MTTHEALAIIVTTTSALRETYPGAEPCAVREEAQDMLRQELDRLVATESHYVDLAELLFGEAEYDHEDVRNRLVAILDEAGEACDLRTSVRFLAHFLAQAANQHILYRVARRRCSCGGRGPHDPACCPACHVLHDLGVGL